MLKAAVVGGPSLVFTRKHVAGQTRIRSHKYDLARIVKRILGFDANSLYPSTIAQAAKDLIPRMYSKRWFGFAEVDIEVPRDLWEKFEEFPPIFINQSVGEEGIPQHMKDYLHEHGLEITAVHRTIDYIPRKIFDWFGQEVANMQRKGDVEAEKALFAEIYKLLGNSAYGKFIEAVERQTKVLCTKDEDVVDRHLRSAYFEDLEEIGDVQDRIPKKQGYNKPTLSSRHRGISADQVANVAVLLRLLGPLPRQARLRAYPDGHGQYVLRPFVRHFGRSSKARTSEGV